jgi:hypothetical protein
MRRLGITLRTSKFHWIAALDAKFGFRRIFKPAFWTFDFSHGYVKRNFIRMQFA